MITAAAGPDSFETVFFQESIESRAGHTECAGGLRFVSVKNSEHALNVIALECIECLESAGDLRMCSTKVDVFSPYHVATRENHGSGEAILELTNVAWPLMRHEELDRLA